MLYEGHLERKILFAILKNTICHNESNLKKNFYNVISYVISQWYKYEKNK